MPKYWRISDRAIRDGQPSSTEQGPLSYWTADNLAKDHIKVKSNKEIVAIIAYLQRLGTDIKAGKTANN